MGELTKEEYDAEIRNILDKIKQDASYNAVEELTYLKQYLPIRLGWYYANMRSEERRVGKEC